MPRDILHTKFCDMFGVQYPVVAFTHCKDVAVAVCKAGGTAVLGAAGHTPDEIAADVAWIRERIGNNYAFGIDLLIPASVPEHGDREQYAAQVTPEHWAFVKKIKDEYGLGEAVVRRGMGGTFSQESARKQLDTVLELKVPIFASGLGNPAFVLDAAHANGVKVFGLIGKTRQARRELEAGVDVIVAQGHDAGGHNSPIGTFSLIPSVVRIAGDTPVLLAGGVGTGEQLVAALIMGAVGVWTGSLWLASHESNEDIYVKEKIVASTEEGTSISRALTGKPARLLKNAWTDAWERPDAPKTLPMPLQGILANEVLQPARDKHLGEFMGTGAGQVIGLIDSMKSCRAILDDLIEEARDVIDRVFGESEITA